MEEHRLLFIPRRGFKGQSTTLEAYNRDLGYLGDWLQQERLTIEKMTAAHWDQFIEFRGWAYKAQRRALSASRFILRRMGMVNHPLFTVEWPQGVRKPQRTLKLSQRNKLLEAAQDTQNPKRDTALIRLLWDVGGRKFEIADALWEMADIEGHTIKLLTKAEDLKPRQWETKRFSSETAEALAEWRTKRALARLVFGLSREGISSVFKRLSVRVGFRVSPHDFRRGIGTYMAENGVSDRLAMKQLGIKTHAVYQNYSEAAQLKALDGMIW